MVIESGANSDLLNTIRPKIASTMLGTPAITSTPDSTSRASHTGRPYSDSQMAMPRPIGPAIGDTQQRERQRALDRVQEPAGLALVDRGRRVLRRAG